MQYSCNDDNSLDAFLYKEQFAWGILLNHNFFPGVLKYSELRMHEWCRKKGLIFSFSRQQYIILHSKVRFLKYPKIKFQDQHHLLFWHFVIDIYYHISNFFFGCKVTHKKCLCNMKVGIIKCQKKWGRIHLENFIFCLFHFTCGALRIT